MQDRGTSKPSNHSNYYVESHSRWKLIKASPSLLTSTEIDVERLMLSYARAWGPIRTAFQASSNECSASASMMCVIETNDIDRAEWWRISSRTILHEAPFVHARSPRSIQTLQEARERR